MPGVFAAGVGMLAGGVAVLAGHDVLTAPEANTAT